MKKYDLCVIGAGPAGYAAAMRAMDYGKKVALVEKNKVGGAGIYNGALSSKTLWELSESYQVTRSNKFGFHVLDSQLSYSAVINEMNQAVNDKYIQLRQQIEYFCKKGNLTFIKGHAQLKSKNEIQISTNEYEEEHIFAENIVLALGSSPRKLASIEVDEEVICTSDGVCNFKDFPKSIVILGAGVIGCEFATIFSNFGKTKVHLIDKQDRILPFEDEDVSYTIAKNLESNGVVIHRGSSLEYMKQVNGNVEFMLKFNDGRQEIHTVEKALISVGRVPNIINVGLEDVGVELNNQGYAIDVKTQTTVPNIYAVGDFTADIALVNIAELEGRYAVERIFDKNVKDLIYDNISTIMFLNPEVAAVGMNELQARKNNIPYKLAKMNYKFISRAIAKRKEEGFFKILVTDDDDMKVLGMRALGAHASSTIEVIALLISKGLSIRELVDLIHPHPSIPEGIQECARMLCGQSIMKAEVFNLDLRCYRVSEEGRVSDLLFDHGEVEELVIPTDFASCL